MKVLKIIVGIIVFVIGLYLAWAFMSPETYTVTREAQIKAPSNLVMAHIANFKEWENWSPWRPKDPNAKYTFEGPEYGIGSKMSWEGNDSVGTGSMTIATLEENSLMIFDLEFTSPWESKSKGKFELVDGDDGMCTIKWSVTGDMGFMMRPMAQGMMEVTVGPDFVKGLERLKAHVEEHIAMEPAKPNYSVEEVSVESMNYISVTDSTSKEKIGETFGAMMQQLGAYVGEKQIEVQGPSFAIYHSWTDEGTRIETAFPVAEGTTGSDAIATGTSYAGNAVKITFKGSYEQSYAVHETLHKYIADNGKEIVGAPWEVYLVSMNDTQNQDELVTEVYYPVK